MAACALVVGDDADGALLAADTAGLPHGFLPHGPKPPLPPGPEAGPEPVPPCPCLRRVGKSSGKPPPASASSCACCMRRGRVRSSSSRSTPASPSVRLSATEAPPPLAPPSLLPGAPAPEAPAPAAAARRSGIAGAAFTALSADRFPHTPARGGGTGSGGSGCGSSRRRVPLRDLLSSSSHASSSSFGMRSRPGRPSCLSCRPPLPPLPSAEDGAASGLHRVPLTTGRRSSPMAEPVAEPVADGSSPSDGAGACERPGARLPLPPRCCAPGAEAAGLQEKLPCVADAEAPPPAAPRPEPPPLPPPRPLPLLPIVARSAES